MPTNPKKKFPILLVLASGVAFTAGFLLPGEPSPLIAEPGKDAPPAPATHTTRTSPPVATAAATSLSLVERGDPRTAAEFVAALQDLHPEDRDFLLARLGQRFDEAPDDHILFIKEVALLLSGEDRAGGLHFIGRFAREPRILNIERHLVAQWANTDIDGLFQSFRPEVGEANQSQLFQVAAVLAEESTAHFGTWLEKLAQLEAPADWDLQRGGFEAMAQQAAPAQRKAVLDQLMLKMAGKEGFWAFPAILIGNHTLETPEEARQWLLDLPPGPWKDHSLSSFLQATGLHNPAFGAEFLNDPASLEMFNVAWKFDEQGQPVVVEGSLEDMEFRKQFHDLALSHFFDNALGSNPAIVAASAEAFHDPKLKELYLDAARRHLDENAPMPAGTAPAHQHGPGCKH